jgi:putative membrane protein
MKKTAIATTSLLALCLALPAAAEGPDQYGDTGNSVPAGATPAPGASGTPGAPATNTTGDTPVQASSAAAQQTAKEISRQDRKFIEKAAVGGMAEVQMGQLAAQKGQNQAVRDYGNAMVTEHTAGNQRLMNIAGSMGVTPPADLDFMHRRMAKKLNKQREKEFDETYIESQIKDHKKMIELFEEQGRDGQSTELKQFASEMLPKLRNHLQMAEQVQGQIKQKP